jgi:cation:H+ antiporter
LVVSLALLVKSADWLVESAETVGRSLGISPFIIGVTVVAIGTSMPELVAAFVAVFKGVPELVVANAVGSNLTNIFLIVGLSAVAARILVVKRSLIDVDLPLLSVATALFLFVAWDRVITVTEGLILTVSFFVYFIYTILHRQESQENDNEDAFPQEHLEELPSRVDRREKESKKNVSDTFTWRTGLFLLLGVVGLAIGSNYVVDSVVHLSSALSIAVSFIAITAVALGTSLPELVVSVKAALTKKYEVALGNIFGSNVFNVLAVVGLPALAAPLVVDDLTFFIGLPFLVAASVLFVISGISRRIHIWEGLMFLILYALFLVQLWEFATI